MKAIRNKILVIALLTLIIASMTVYAANDKINAKSDIQKIVLVHYNKGHENGKSGGSQGKTPACYKFLSKSQVTLPGPTDYVINPGNSWQLPASFVVPAITAGAEAWDSATSKELFNAPTISTSPETEYGVFNGVNSVSFDIYMPAGVMAVTTVWYSQKQGKIVEFDMLFDEHWNWGDAAQDSSKTDLQDIATHEFGHVIGLGDLTDTKCMDETMYAYSSIGETLKRTLNTGDLQGLQKLYGN